MNQDNPYSAPKAEIRKSVAVNGTIHTDRDLFVIPIGTELPDVCLFTGKTKSGTFVDKKFVWAPPWVYVFFLVNLLVLLIVYLIVRKQGRLKYYVDDTITQKKKKIARIGWGLFALQLIAFIAGIAGEIPLLIGLPILGSLVLLIVVLVILPKLRITKIDKQFIYLKGVPKEAIDQILAKQEAA